MTIPRPTSTPKAFATGASRRTEPDAGDLITGIEDGDRIPARIMNWLWGLPAEWDAYLAQFTDDDDELVYPAAKPRVIMVPLGSGVPSDQTGGWILSGGITTYQLVSDGATTTYEVFPLPSLVASGSIITGVKAIVDPASARAGGARMSLSLYVVAHDMTTVGSNPVAPAVLSSVFDDTTGNKQFLVLTGLAEEVDRVTGDYFIAIKAGGASVGFDRIYGLEVSYDELGPGNR